MRILVNDQQKSIHKKLYRYLSKKGHQIDYEDGVDRIYHRLRQDAYQVLILPIGSMNQESTNVIDMIQKTMPHIMIYVLGEPSQPLENAKEEQLVTISYPYEVSSVENKMYLAVMKDYQDYKKEKMPKKRKKRHPVIKAILCLLVSVLLVGMFYIQYNLRGVPDLDYSLYDQYRTSEVIVATNGDEMTLSWVEIEDIPQELVDAFVSIEDKRFYSHHGIDYVRLVGAILGQITGNANYGASTITQQLIKNVYLSSEVTYRRKIQEIYLALQLEQVLSKDEIMEWYLNIVFMGGTVYGVKNASEAYFSKDLSELSLRQYACLAGVVQSPNNYNPRAGYLRGDMSLTNQRTNTVLYAMLENEKISKDAYDEAVIADLEVHLLEN